MLGFGNSQIKVQDRFQGLNIFPADVSFLQKGLPGSLLFFCEPHSKTYKISLSHFPDSSETLISDSVLY